MTQIHKKLIAIKESESYEELEQFKEKALWPTFADEERMLLARLLVKQGEMQLALGNQKVLETFEIAAQLSSYSTEILLTQGKILSSYEDNFRCLQLAAQIFSRIILEDPNIFEAYFERAKILVQVGLFENELSYLLEANHDFNRAESLFAGQNKISSEEFYWKWANALAISGKFSGEPLDFQIALNKYYRLYEQGLRNPDFLSDYGECFVYLAVFLRKQEYYQEALQLFDQAIDLSDNHFRSWFNHACCLFRLYELTPSIEFAELAEMSFIRAADINAFHPGVWLRWAQLEATYGKAKRDLTKLKSALIKYEHCHKLDPENPDVLSQWADLELFLGSIEDCLEFVYAAQDKIVKGIKLYPEGCYNWHLFGLSFNELGRYFADAKFFHLAIEKFEYGLSLSQNNYWLWYGLALSHFSLGELEESKELFERSIKYFSKVLENGGDFPQFWNDWGVSLMRLGELTNQAYYLEMAIEKFEKCLALPIDKIQDEGVDLEWVCNYGCAFDLLGDLADEPQHFEKAVQVLTQVIQFDPEYQQARYNLALAISHLAEVMYDSDLYLLAAGHFQYLIEKDPEDEMVHMDYGMALISWGLLVQDDLYSERSEKLYQQAENHLMHAISLGNTQSYYQLAGLYSIIGNFDQSMHFLHRAQRADVLPSIEDVMQDAWLENVSRSESFRKFIRQLSSQYPFSED